MTTKEIHERLKAVPGGGAAADLMSFAGSWSDLPEEQFASLAAEWQERRHGMIIVKEAGAPASC